MNRNNENTEYEYALIPAQSSDALNKQTNTGKILILSVLEESN